MVRCGCRDVGRELFTGGSLIKLKERVVNEKEYPYKYYCQKINAWLDEQSAETGLTKSAIVLFLLKITKTKKEGETSISELSVLVEEMKKLAEQVEKE